MRVTSDLFVSALMRRVFSGGGYAAVVHRGATEAGAIFAVVRGRMGDATLYGPAPQTSYEPGGVEDRLFGVMASGDMEEIDRRLERERRFDPDAWVVEVEPGADAIETLIQLAKS
jgi:hypothetical protein